MAKADLVTIKDLLTQLGGISPSRVLLRPAPGQATETDVIAAEARYGRLCELVDGVLVEKGMGYPEASLAALLLTHLRVFVDPRNLGLVTGADGMVRLFPGLVRIPDVAFASWGRIPGRKFPKEPLFDLAPDLVVEVLSKSNTRREMQRKLREYFEAGIRLVWMVDPKKRVVTVHAADAVPFVLDESQALDGAPVLPGFALSLRELFAELDRHG